MKSNNPYNSYKETQIKTAGQGKLIVMLYEGAIKFLNLAKKGIDEKNIELAHNNIVKGQDIIMELLLSLNMEAGDIAHKLYNLYLYMNNRLMEANINKDKKPIDEVLKLLTELKEVWEQVIPEGNNVTPPSDDISSINIAG